LARSKIALPFSISVGVPGVTISAMFRTLIFLLIASSSLLAQDRVINLLKDLTDLPGPPGYEEPVRKFMADNMKPMTDKITYDGLGSVIAQQGSSGPRIMLDAHMDELGGMVKRVRPDGFISIQMLGYWLDQALPDQRWVIVGSKGPVPAVSDLWDAHIAPRPSPNATASSGPREVFLDVGARNPAEVEALGISPGDPVAPVTDFQVIAKSLRRQSLGRSHRLRRHAGSDAPLATYFSSQPGVLCGNGTGRRQH
jgi:endoglucanase